MNAPRDLAGHLWNDDPKQNGYTSEEQYRNHILEQYRVVVEMADRISSRRDLTNNFFLTLNGIVLAGGGAIVERGIQFESKWALLFPAVGLWILCFVWWRIISSYRQINTAKFQILGEFEKRLPASPYWRAEWKFLLEEGKTARKYLPLTHIEAKIPFLFAVGYLVALIALWNS